jgi:hypothetical protein
MSLFRYGRFTLHSGGESDFRIDCDALTDDDLASLAAFIVPKLPPFRSVEPVPRGGVRLAEALRLYAQAAGCLLIADDVLTSGASMETQRDGRDARGVVLFSRSMSWPSWVWPLFVLYEPPQEEGKP